MARIDPTDPIYQVSDQFKPDNEKEWKFPLEKDGWVCAHNALRSELKWFRETLQAMKERDDILNAWKLKALNTAADGHLDHIHGHHTNEDVVFVPELKKRFKYPPKLESDHITLEEKLNSVRKIISELKEGDKIDDLLTIWIEYENMLLPHLLEEEEVGLPLYRAYFPPKDGGELVAKVMKRASKFELGSFIYFMGERKFRKEFMKQEGIPGFVWYLDFKKMLKYFVVHFVNNMEALSSGKEPVPAPEGTCQIL